MSKVRLRSSFSNIPDADLLTFGKHVSQMMTGNTNFTTPSPSLATLNTAISDYESALGKMEDPTKVDTSNKNQKRAVLEGILSDLTNYVEANCGNDPTKALSSGFDLFKTPAPASIPATPAGVKAVAGAHSGEIIVSCDAQPDATMFDCRYTTSIATPVWTLVMAQPNRRFLISGLTHGQDVWVSMCAINTAGTSGWSDAVMVLVD